ncbi:Lrp/AsnC family transcriptional regulator [Anaerolineae bacterium CFX7]|nr:Lrp/AsnC family transcriptional regulator [Anaerolineae bacterium CFX7]
MRAMENTLDDLDKKILAIVQRDGRITNADLAQQIHLSPPAAHARLKRLQERGIIRGFVALLDQERLGYDLMALIHVTLAQHQRERVQEFRAAIQTMPQVLECFHVTGEYDYLLKVVVRNRQELEQFLVETLTPAPGVGRIHTNIVFSQVKTTTELQISNARRAAA